MKMNKAILCGFFFAILIGSFAGAEGQTVDHLILSEVQSAERLMASAWQVRKPPFGDAGAQASRAANSQYNDAIDRVKNPEEMRFIVNSISAQYRVKQGMAVNWGPLEKALEKILTKKEFYLPDASTMGYYLSIIFSEESKKFRISYQTQNDFSTYAKSNFTKSYQEAKTIARFLTGVNKRLALDFFEAAGNKAATLEEFLELKSMMESVGFSLTNTSVYSRIKRQTLSAFESAGKAATTPEELLNLMTLMEKDFSLKNTGEYSAIKRKRQDILDAPKTFEGKKKQVEELEKDIARETRIIEGKASIWEKVSFFLNHPLISVAVFGGNKTAHIEQMKAKLAGLRLELKIAEATTGVAGNSSSSSALSQNASATPASNASSSVKSDASNDY